MFNYIWQTHLRYLIYLLNSLKLSFIWLLYLYFKNGEVIQLAVVYDPNWNSLDTRPLPEWYDRAKIGIFLHWGVYSVPSFGSEWFWFLVENPKSNKYGKFMQSNYPPGFTYQDFAPMFTAEFFDPDQWASLFKRSGAKYIVLTTKHHDGYTLFPSKRCFSWNSVDTGPHRDLVGELSTAVRAQGLTFGVYYSLYEWFNPIYIEDRNRFYYRSNYTDGKLLPDLKQLVNDYQPTVIWADGDWEAEDMYWKSTTFLAWLYNESPVGKEVVVNDRWGHNVRCKNGDFYNCFDRYNPGIIQRHKWEDAFTIDKRSWGYRRNMKLKDIMTMEELLKQIVSTVSCGGNALINIGPTKEGTISPIFQERLTSLGAWLDINGPGIYGTSPWKRQNDTLNSNVWYTCTKLGYDGLRPSRKPTNKDKIIAIYAIVLEWPFNNILEVKDLAAILHTESINKLEMLGNEDKLLEWNVSSGLALIQFPEKLQVKSEYAWTIKLSLGLFCLAYYEYTLFLRINVEVTKSFPHKYDPNWNSLDTRPLPEWYDRAKIGIFLHWGVYSVPSFGSEWFWYYLNVSQYETFMQNNYPPSFTYQDFAPMFTAEFFDPDQWASLFKRSGAKYIILTTKHHDGYTLFPSKRSFSWNSVDTGPHRDLVGELSTAVRAQGLTFGVYYSLYEWYNPIYLEDKNNSFVTRNYTETKLWPDLKQLVNDYRPSVIWADGDWEAKYWYWRSTLFLAWLYNESPVKFEVVVNDRWGQDTACTNGDFYTCYDRFNPGVHMIFKWENAFTIDKKTWTYRRNMKLNDIMTMEELLKQIVSTVSCGGNALINIGPTKEGTISPIFQERLTSLGAWLDINGPGIYGTSPWHAQKDSHSNSDVWYTCTKLGYDGLSPTRKPNKKDKITSVFAIVLQWPPNNILQVKELALILHAGNYKLTMLGDEDKPLGWRVDDGHASIQFPDKSQVKSEYAWTIKLSLIV